MKKVKWFFKELVLIYSNKPSFFSKKRIESGISFLIAQVGMIFFLAVKYDSLSMGEFILWASAEFAVAGYIINKIQKEKSIEEVTGELEATQNDDTEYNDENNK
jgi:hypothetical protein